MGKDITTAKMTMLQLISIIAFPKRETNSLEGDKEEEDVQEAFPMNEETMNGLATHTVVNVSGTRLSDSELSLLSWGIAFSPTCHFDVFSTIPDVNHFVRNILLRKHFSGSRRESSSAVDVFESSSLDNMSVAHNSFLFLDECAGIFGAITHRLFWKHLWSGCWSTI